MPQPDDGRSLTVPQVAEEPATSEVQSIANCAAVGLGCAMRFPAWV